MTVSPTARLPRQPPASAQVRAPHSMDYNPDTMALITMLITSDCDAMRSPSIKMTVITSDCAPSSSVADEHSELNGTELVRRKVKRIAIMAGSRRRGGHSADSPSPTRVETPTAVRGGCSEITVSPMAWAGQYPSSLHGMPEWNAGGGSRRRDCHFDDTRSPSLLKHLIKVQGDAAG